MANKAIRIIQEATEKYKKDLNEDDFDKEDFVETVSEYIDEIPEDYPNYHKMMYDYALLLRFCELEKSIEPIERGEVIEYFKKAANFKPKSGALDIDVINRSAYGMGMIYYSEKEYDRAIKYIRFALDREDDKTKREGIRKTLTNIQEEKKASLNKTLKDELAELMNGNGKQKLGSNNY